MNRKKDSLYFCHLLSLLAKKCIGHWPAVLLALMISIQAHAAGDFKCTVTVKLCSMTFPDDYESDRIVNSVLLRAYNVGDLMDSIAANNHSLTVGNHRDMKCYDESGCTITAEIEGVIDEPSDVGDYSCGSQVYLSVVATENTELSRTSSRPVIEFHYQSSESKPSRC